MVIMVVFKVKLFHRSHIILHSTMGFSKHMAALLAIVDFHSGFDSSSGKVPEYNRSSICSTHSHSLHILSHVKQMQ